jgi:hypothetical protein
MKQQTPCDQCIRRYECPLVHETPLFKELMAEHHEKFRYLYAECLFLNGGVDRKLKTSRCGIDFSDRIRSLVGHVIGERQWILN